MAFNVTVLDKIIRETLEPAIQKTFPTEVPMLDFFNTEKRDIKDGKFHIALDVQRIPGFGALDADNLTHTLPSPGSPVYDQASVPVKQVYQTIAVTGLAISETQGNPNALASVLTEAAQKATENLAFHLDRMSIMDGTGAVCQVNGAVLDGTTIAIDSAYWDDPSFWFTVGDKIDIHNGTTFQATNVEVTAVSANSITVDTAVTVDDNANIYFHGSFDGTNYNEMVGLLGIVDDEGIGGASTFQGIDTTKDYWQAQIIDLGGSALSFDSINNIKDKIRKNSRGKITMAWCDFDVRNKYRALLEAKQQITKEVVSNTGWTGLSYTADGKKIVIIDYWKLPKQTMFFLDRDAVKFFILEKMGWIDLDGSKFVRPYNMDAIYGSLKVYGNFGTLKRNATGRLDNIGV